VENKEKFSTKIIIDQQIFSIEKNEPKFKLGVAPL
jgi:hypothetical protein